MGFGLDRLRMNVNCKEAPGSEVFTDPAAEDEGGDYRIQWISVTARLRNSDLNDRYRQRRDCTRQLVAQLSKLNSRKKLTATEVRLLAKKLFKEDIKKYGRFDTLATTLCDQQDTLDEAHRHYDAHVQSSADSAIDA